MMRPEGVAAHNVHVEQLRPPFAALDVKHQAGQHSRPPILPRSN
jgi:hypothetical protein